MSKWRKANRGGGKTRNRWKLHEDAVVAEIMRRERVGSLVLEEPEAEASVGVAVATSTTTVVSSVEVGGYGSSATAREVMLASYADDIRRIHRKFDAEEAGVRKPNPNERLAVAR